MNKIKSLFARKLRWVENSENPVMFDLKEENMTASIRMNDFPDEIMYTIFSKMKQWMWMICQPGGFYNIRKNETILD